LADNVQRNLAAKVAGLKHSSPETRRAVYEELRAALKEEIRAAAPFLPVQTAIAKRSELESAIIAIERLAVKSDPAPAPPSRPVSTPPVVTEIVAETPKAEPDAKQQEGPPFPVYAPSQPEAEKSPRGVPADVSPIAEYIVEIPATQAHPLQPDAPVRAPEPEREIIDRALPTQFAAHVRQEREIPETSHEEYEEPAANVPEFAPPAEVATEPRRLQPAALYIAVAAAAIGAILVVFVLFAGVSEQPAKQVAKNRVVPVANDTPLAMRPSDIPPAPPPTPEIFRSTGFGPAAQNALREANALLARGEYERAIAAFDDAIRFDPRDPAAFGNRAFAHWSRGDATAAVRDYTAALQIQPRNVTFRLNRAVGYNRLGEYGRAIEDLDEVIRAEPANFDALSSRCWAHALHDHLKEALADCNEALKLKAKDANALDSRGLVHLKLGRLDRAVADYNAALRVDPKLVSSLYGRGLARIGRGDRAGGNEDVAAAKAIAPDVQATFSRYGVR
jgi:tetratricopeptide (TPR) repeat protein